MAEPSRETDGGDERAALREEIAQLRKINEALMDRVELDMDRQGNSFSLFQAATALEHQVAERTAALQRTLHALEKSNRELVASNQAAQAANLAKSAFLAAMSHELRTPMNGVIGMTELLLASQLHLDQRRSVEVVRQSALSLLTILNDILDFSKIEAGQMHFESVGFDLCKVTHEVLELLQPQAAAKGLQIEADCPVDLPPAVIGDPTRYKQIMTNLIGNAIKFTARGRVRVSGRLVAEQGDLREYRFEVQDTGIGIRPEVIPRLFNSFTQADNSTTRKFGGTGLGLVIVQRLCRLMGGDCGVRSVYGEGSTFWFTLKLRKGEGRAPVDDLAQTQKLARPRLVAAGAMRVLVAEDNAVNQEVATALLRAIGCSSRVARNGREALELLAAGEQFDVVLMDCQMPEIDGYEASRRIRQREQGSGEHIPIIALTANAMSGDREACLAAGMDDFLSKPFQIHQLRAMLDKWKGLAPPAAARL